MNANQMMEAHGVEASDLINISRAAMVDCRMVGKFDEGEVYHYLWLKIPKYRHHMPGYAKAGSLRGYLVNLARLYCRYKRQRYARQALRMNEFHKYAEIKFSEADDGYTREQKQKEGMAALQAVYTKAELEFLLMYAEFGPVELSRQFQVATKRLREKYAELIAKGKFDVE
ncbi:hypothetical protein EBR57_10560 [bacterium]|nr:hypothetical protein [bacterium]